MVTRGVVRRSLALAVSLAAVAAVTAGTSSAGAAGLPGGSASSGKPIHPGVSVNYGDVTCTVGAVLKAGRRVFLAVPASCGGIDLGKAGTDGCVAPQTPLGAPVSIEGAKHRGVLVYSSFSEMQLRGDQNPNRCYYNDLSLVQVDRRDRARVSAAIPGVGVPLRVVAKLPKSGSSLLVGGSSATAGATNHKGWELDMSSPTAMWKTPDCGSSVTRGRNLVGMLLVLPKGPIPGAPVAQTAAQTFNLYRSLKYLRTTPHFHRVHLPLR